MEIVDLGEHFSAVVSSEDEAWELLRRTLDGEFGDKAVIPVFDGWPNQEIVFWIEDKHEVLTAPMMEALLDYQKGLYRTFLYLTEDTTNLRRLSEELRARYEVEFQVGEGCTRIIPDWDAITTQVIGASIDKMDGTHLTICIVALALVWGGVSVTRAIIDYKSKKAAEESSSSITKRLLEAQEFASEQETKRLKMVSDALLNATGSRALMEAHEDAQSSLIRSAARVDATDIAGVRVDSEVARRIARKSRMEPVESIIEGRFTVLRNDAAPNTRFRVKLRHEESGEEFFAHIRDALLAGDDRQVISDAEWRQIPFWAQVEVRRSRGDIVDATVVQALRNAG